MPRIRLDNGVDQRQGNPGNRGSPRGQVVRAADAAGHTIAECWRLLFECNAQAPAAFKAEDHDLTNHMAALFPQRYVPDVWHRPWQWRLSYNKGLLHGMNGPPKDDLFSWRYMKIENVDFRPLEPPTIENAPYFMYAVTARGVPKFRVFPPEPDWRYKELSHVFKIPRPDFSEFPFPGTARAQYYRIRKARLAAEREAFQEFMQEWIRRQERERPQDFDPTIWRDPKW